MREDRQGAAGLSQTSSSRAWATARISALRKPASSNGDLTPNSVAARWPGRCSPTSSAVYP